jgi:hypothetical protein
MLGSGIPESESCTIVTLERLTGRSVLEPGVTSSEVDAVRFEPAALTQETVDGEDRLSFVPAVRLSGVVEKRLPDGPRVSVVDDVGQDDVLHEGDYLLAGMCQLIGP